MFAGLCQNQRDVMVAQQQQRRDSKKIRDNQKRTHATLKLEPPLSPISPEPVEPEIPSVEEMITSFQGLALYDQMAEQYFGGSSSTPPPPPPYMGSHPSYFFGGAGSFGAAPFYSYLGFSTFGASGTSTMAPLHGTESEASRPSAVKIVAQTAAASIKSFSPVCSRDCSSNSSCLYLWSSTLYV